MSAALAIAFGSGALWCLLEAVEAQRRVHSAEGPVDVTPDLRRAARLGHGAAVCATAAGLLGLEREGSVLAWLVGLVVTRALALGVVAVLARPPRRG